MNNLSKRRDIKTNIRQTDTMVPFVERGLLFVFKLF